MPQAMRPRRSSSAAEIADVRRRVAQGVGNTGLLGPHYKELQDLPPEIASIDLLSFPALVTAAGGITQPDSQSLPGGYIAELVEIRGFSQNVGTDPELAPKIDFNIRDRERTGNVFSNNVEMAHLVGSANGMPTPLKFDRGLYVFGPGSRVGVDFTIDTDGTTGYATLAAETKEWGILLVFGLYAAQTA